ncbi:hypothetical protein BT96DRAFT_997267 [Gymnopus androsaceus JB14]|uniref:Uncharacterized protein n=1 Tax=Gymnopus androsaceus JB14 TaxID=1447944 RepID=A0A6A4HDM3_9AGAR|nr:hypothetical protein BT96DRAFT_997267 [Gymnopus androsaceus JB14]
MPQNTKPKAQKAGTAKSTQPKPFTAKSRKGKTSSEPPLKRGNKGNFHGYAAAEGKKFKFWVDFFAARKKKYPPLDNSWDDDNREDEDGSHTAAAKDPPAVGAESSAAAAAEDPPAVGTGSGAAADASSATAEPSGTAAQPCGAAEGNSSAGPSDTPEPTKADDPSILFARHVVKKMLKRWFSTRLTRQKTAQKNPFEKYLSALNTHRGAPHTPQQPSCPSSSPSPDKNAAKGLDQSSGSGPTTENPEERGEGEKVDADNEEDEEDGSDGEEGSKYVLAHRVRTAKEMFVWLSEDEKAALREELDKDHDEKKECYDRALKGEDYYDPALLDEHRRNLAVLAGPLVDAVAAMCQGMVSLNLICLDKPDEEGGEPKLFMRNMMSQNTE